MIEPNFADEDHTGELVLHHGGCHCGRVRFAVRASRRLQVQTCNCSICLRSRYLHLIVPADRFELLSGSEALAEYRFNTGQARHLFCRYCGVKSFYVPRSHPNGYSINQRCIDPGTVESINIEKFDGVHWEAAARQFKLL